MRAHAMIRPYPGWHIGSWVFNYHITLILRRLLWKLLKAPCVIPWLNDIRLYIFPRNETAV